MMDLNKDRVLFRMIHNFNEKEMRDPEILASEKGLYDRLCGCIFGGSVTALRRYIPAYLKVFAETLAAKRFVGVDQRLFAITALQHPELVIFQPPNEYETQSAGCPYPYPHALWMGLYNWLGGDTLHDEIVQEDTNNAGDPIPGTGTKSKTCLKGLHLKIIQDGKLVNAPWSRGYPEK
jgi:hypothetical protein